MFNQVDRARKATADLNKVKTGVPVLQRKTFLKNAGGVGATVLLSAHIQSFASRQSPEPEGMEALHFASPNMELRLAPSAPEILAFTVDGLGKTMRGAHIVDPKPAGSGYAAAVSGERGV